MYERFSFSKNMNIFFVTLHRFYFRKTVSKMLNYQFFLLWKQYFVVTTNKTWRLISRGYVAERAVDI